MPPRYAQRGPKLNPFLAPFDPTVIAAARTLVEKGRVRLEGHTHQSIEGRVKTEEDTIRVQLTRKGLLWEADSDAEEEEVHNLAACATIMEAEGQPEMEAPATVPEKTLHEIVEDKLSGSSRRLRGSTSPKSRNALNAIGRSVRSTTTIWSASIPAGPFRATTRSSSGLNPSQGGPGVLELPRCRAPGAQAHLPGFPRKRHRPARHPGPPSVLEDQEDLPRWAERIREFSQREAPACPA